MTRWLILLLLILLGLTAPKWFMGWRYGGRIHSPQAVPPRSVAIVFGAGLRRDGTPTTVLADRVDTAVELYRSGKVEQLLMTGSAGEPASMAARARSLGVPLAAILIDTGGERTYESCARARQAGITSALLVSQRFHLPRALALCGAMGIDADGVGADRSRYSTRARTIWSLREVPASWVALVESLLARPGQV